MVQDFRFGLRLLNRHRGYAATAILTVVLAGANIAVFSVADSVLFRPLPFADVDRLFMCVDGESQDGADLRAHAGGECRGRAGTGLFDASALRPSSRVRWCGKALTLGALDLANVPPQYLEMLGVRPILRSPVSCFRRGNADRLSRLSNG